MTAGTGVITADVTDVTIDCRTCGDEVIDAPVNWDSHQNLIGNQARSVPTTRYIAHQKGGNGAHVDVSDDDGSSWRTVWQARPADNLFGG